MWAEPNRRQRCCGVEKFSAFRAANLHQFSPEKAQREPLLVAERPEPDTTMEGKRSRTDSVGVLSQFLRLEVKVRGVARAGKPPLQIALTAAGCLHGDGRKSVATWNSLRCCQIHPFAFLKLR